MTKFTWVTDDRQAAGISDDPAGSAITLEWGPADALIAGGSIPWARPAYPTLLITGLGTTMTTVAAVANRRLSLTVSGPVGQLTYLSSGTQAANLTRRWEAALGFALDTTLANSVYREPLSGGFMLLPLPASSLLTVTIFNVQSGDTLGPLSIRGVLLPP